MSAHAMTDRCLGLSGDQLGCTSGLGVALGGVDLGEEGQDRPTRMSGSGHPLSEGVVEDRLV